ncbi:hypothetical protein CYMTET_56481 [Cymbomonas tetramitiformis]|uniref:Receptor ligand binding region domain-containing protein n=1 Tax=Cymbomonas tetramitiformis TaxID=36881 RepID=A0AAE0BC27_9CHLO|nr:hypothetical protein CYMTET_56481 [Cymbomonas tetramitiformis]
MSSSRGLTLALVVLYAFVIPGDSSVEYCASELHPPTWEDTSGVTIPSGWGHMGIEPLCCDYHLEGQQYPGPEAAADCDSNCVSNATLWNMLTNRVCDDGLSQYNLNCAAYNYDAGDCGANLTRFFSNREAYNFTADVCTRMDLPKCTSGAATARCYEDCAGECFNLQSQCTAGQHKRVSQRCLQVLADGTCDSRDDTALRIDLSCPLWDYEDQDCLQEYQVDLLAIYPTTGAWTGGSEARYAVEMAVDEINSSPAFFSNVNGSKALLQVSWIESECSAATIQRNLVDILFEREDRHFSAIIGGGCSSVCEVVASVATAMRIPELSYGCSSPRFTTKREQYEYFSRLQYSEAQTSQPIITLLRQMNWTRFGTIHDRSHTLFTAFMESLWEDAELAEMEVVPVSFYGSNAEEELPSQLEALQNANITVIVWSCYEPQAQTMFKLLTEMKQQGGTAPGAALAAQEHVWIGPGGTLRLWVVGMWSQQNVQDNAHYQDFATAYAARLAALNSSTPDSYVTARALAYDVTYALALALNSTLAATGTVNGPQVLAALRSVEFTGATGSVKINSDGDPSSPPFQLHNLQPSNGNLAKVNIATLPTMTSSWDEADLAALQFRGVWDDAGEVPAPATRVPLDSVLRVREDACSRGFYFSHAAKKCIDCMAHSLCFSSYNVSCLDSQLSDVMECHGSDMVASEGYWIDSVGIEQAFKEQPTEVVLSSDMAAHLSRYITMCPMQGRCKHGQADSSCEEGYTGRLCSECAEGLEVTIHGCEECGDKIEGWKRLDVVLPAAVVVQAIGSYFYLFTSRRVTEVSAKLDILIFFYQLLAMSISSAYGTTGYLAAFNLNVPETEREDEEECSWGRYSTFALFYTKLLVIAGIFTALGLSAGTDSLLTYLFGKAALDRVRHALMKGPIALKRKIDICWKGDVVEPIVGIKAAGEKRPRIVSFSKWIQDFDADKEKAESLEMQAPRPEPKITTVIAAALGPQPKITTEAQAPVGPWLNADHSILQTECFPCCLNPEQPQIAPPSPAVLDKSSAYGWRNFRISANIRLWLHKSTSSTSFKTYATRIQRRTIIAAVTVQNAVLMPASTACFAMLSCFEIYENGERVWVLSADQSITCPDSWPHILGGCTGEEGCALSRAQAVALSVFGILLVVAILRMALMLTCLKVLHPISLVLASHCQCRQRFVAQILPTSGALRALQWGYRVEGLLHPS